MNVARLDIGEKSITYVVPATTSRMVRREYTCRFMNMSVKVASINLK